MGEEMAQAKKAEKRWRGMKEASCCISETKAAPLELQKVRLDVEVPPATSFSCWGEESFYFADDIRFLSMQPILNGPRRYYRI